MIQRIQSIYLLLTSVLPVLFLKGNFLKFLNNDGSEMIMNFKGTWQLTGTENLSLLQRQIPFSAVIVLISVVSVIALFLYRNRKLQVIFANVIIFLSIVLVALIAWYAFSVAGKFDATLLPGIKMVIPLMILIFAILAQRGIKHDENLVRSYDRLR
jgi:glucan phosphoethanolaminetransferase (alkaline phosphatase superfamily)